MKIGEIWLGGVLIVVLAFCTAAQGYLTSDEAFKFVGPKTLFWLKGAIVTAGGIALALKSYMSTAWASHIQNKAKEEKPEEPGPFPYRDLK